MKSLMNIKITLVLVSALAAPIASYAQPQASKESIIQLLEMTNTIKSVQQSIDPLLRMLKTLKPDAPDEFWSDIRNNINSDNFTSLIIPIYQKHLSEEDVQNLIAFYKTPTGKKFITVKPMLDKEAVSKGREWGQKLVAEVDRKHRLYIKNHPQQQK